MKLKLAARALAIALTLATLISAPAHAGRFLSPDPKDQVDGPNVYGFCGGDPVNRTDPMGTDWVWHDGKWEILYPTYEMSTEYLLGGRPDVKGGYEGEVYTYARRAIQNLLNSPGWMARDYSMSFIEAEWKSIAGFRRSECLVIPDDTPAWVKYEPIRTPADIAEYNETVRKIRGWQNLSFAAQSFLAINSANSAQMRGLQYTASVSPFPSLSSSKNVYGLVNNTVNGYQEPPMSQRFGQPASNARPNVSKPDGVFFPESVKMDLTGGVEVTSRPQQSFATGSEWYENYVAKYGAENVNWVSGSGRTINWPSQLPRPTEMPMFRVRPPVRSSTFDRELAAALGPRVQSALAHHNKPLGLNGADDGAINGSWQFNPEHQDGHIIINRQVNPLPYGTEIHIRN